jgi:BASS family bile acid:Na+ symporter
MDKRMLKYLAQACLWAGFLIPFIASNFVGMPLSRRPLVSAANLILWAIGLLLGYVVYTREKKVSSTTPLWNRFCSYLISIPATFVTLGIAFGYLYYPSVEKNVVTSSVNYLLMATLFAMGVQITPADWKGIIQHPRLVSILVIIRWITMPFVAYLLANYVLLRFFPRPTATAMAIGLLVLGTTPTGAASNTLTLISRGDLALSVSVTSVNTILAPFLQPFLIGLFLGSTASVNRFGIFMDLVKTVLIPITVGSLIGAYWPKLVKTIRPALSAMAVICLALIIMGNMSKGTAVLLKQLWILPLLTATLVAYGLIGLSAGYYLPRLFRFNHKQRVAACFEVGVENAALTQVLIFNHFTPLAALPAIFYGKIQNMLAVTIFVSKFQKVADDVEPAAVAGLAKAFAQQSKG